MNYDQSVSLALIPGVFLGWNPGDSHAFLQVLEGKTGKTTYLLFSLEEFHLSLRDQGLTLGPNRFGQGGIRLDLAREAATFSGELVFREIHPLSSSFFFSGNHGTLRVDTFLGVLSRCFEHGSQYLCVLTEKLTT